MSRVPVSMSWLMAVLALVGFVVVVVSGGEPAHPAQLEVPGDPITSWTEVARP